MRIAFSCGDTNGIGPEITLKSLQKLSTNTDYSYYLSIPGNIFEIYYSSLHCDFRFSTEQNTDSKVSINFQKSVKYQPGIPTAESGSSSFESLENAISGIFADKIQGMVTAPISKYAWAKAGINFPGHTEYLAERSGITENLMFFLSDNLKAALVSIHIPLKSVPTALSSENVSRKIFLLYNSLRNDLNIHLPRIAVLGLNPHAGEIGQLGREELEIIEPAITNCGLPSVFGPFVPDAFFGSGAFKNYDAVLGMYHDQILIPFKLLNFETGTNFTAGLPFVRTSPDHGTAYDITGKGLASDTSIMTAHDWAIRIIENRERSRIAE